MPRTVFDRIAHLWSAQHFGLFWGFDIHNPSGETNACAGFDCSHRLSALGFEFVGSWISTTHSTLGRRPRILHVIRSIRAKSPPNKAFGVILLAENKTLTHPMHRDSTGLACGLSTYRLPTAARTAMDLQRSITSWKTTRSTVIRVRRNPRPACDPNARSRTGRTAFRIVS